MSKVYGCEYCDSEFESRDMIRKHKKTCLDKPLSDIECTFCNKVFVSRNILRKHVNQCSERPSYNCYGCDAKFYSKNDLNYHQTICKEALRKCSWVTKLNRRCAFTGKYEGFCKKHFINYKYYDPDGIKDIENEIEICSMIVNTKYVPSTINHMVNGEFFSLEYNYKTSTFTTKEHNISNIVMENIETKEKMIFWENKEVRKHKPGQLITKLSANYEYECENDALIAFENNDKMCKKCFEIHYNTTTNSLIVRTQNDIEANSEKLTSLKI